MVCMLTAHLLVIAVVVVKHFPHINPNSNHPMAELCNVHVHILFYISS